MGRSRSGRRGSQEILQGPGWVKLRNTQTEYSHSEFPPTTDIDPGMISAPASKKTVTLENSRRGCSVKSKAVACSTASRAWKVAVIAPRQSNIAHLRRSWPAKCNPFAQRYFVAVELAGLDSVYTETWRPRRQDQGETTTRRA